MPPRYQPFYPSRPPPRDAGDTCVPVKDLPIISPHGHTDPRWFAYDQPFANPAELLIVPDHYVFRMLYSQGVRLDELGVPTIDGSATDSDPRAILTRLVGAAKVLIGNHRDISLLLGKTFSGDGAERRREAVEARLRTGVAWRYGHPRRHGLLRRRRELPAAPRGAVRGVE